MKQFKLSNLIFLAFGIIIGYSIFFIRNTESKDSSYVEDSLSSIRPVKEDEIECPLISDNFSDNAKVAFMPVTLFNSQALAHKELNKDFDPVIFSDGLYNFETGNENNNELYPWYVEEIDTHNELGNLTVYYGNTAMNHTPHIAYVIKEGKVIFVANGANINIDASNPNGLETTETLDWNTGKYKRVKYVFSKGKFVPSWYQISCDVI